MIGAFNQAHCNEIFDCAGIPIYIYESKTKSIRYGSLGEITDGDKLVIQTFKSSPRIIAVYH